MSRPANRVAALLPLLALAAPLSAQEEPSEAERIQELERRLAELEGRVGAPPPAPAPEVTSGPAGEEEEELEPAGWSLDLWRALDRVVLGGYGELHANLDLGPERNVLDIHRLVMFVGYQFTDWIRFEAEIELEHALVEGGEDSGELLVEQAFVDFYLTSPFNLRAGRTLVPVGIVNRKHEPPAFNGVERPLFDRVIVPTTWFMDAIGGYGNPLPWLRYEAYLGTGLDGSGISATDGLRGARLQERSSLQEPAFSARLDLFPLAEASLGPVRYLRLGVSTFLGGLNNGPGGDDPDVNAFAHLLSGDFELSVGPLDFRGALAYTRIDRADRLPRASAPSQILGFFAEVAVHVLPPALRRGWLAHADLVVFFRYDDANTQHRVPGGAARLDAGNRHEYTVGINFYPVPNLVAKLDYQHRDDRSTSDPVEVVNLGLGWQF